MNERSSPPDPACVGDPVANGCSCSNAYIQVAVHENGGIELKGTPGDVRRVVERLRQEGFRVRFDYCSWCG